jgi:hypothetical protein
VKDVLGGDGLLADAALGEGQILGDRAVEVMAHHEHVEMLVERVDRERPRRVGRRRQHVLEASHLHDVRRMPSAGALGVEGMNGATLEGSDGILDKAAFVQRVGVDHHLHVVIVGHGEATVDGSRGRAPILVKLQRARARVDLLHEPARQGRISLTGKAEVHREGFRGLDHA